MTQPRACPPGVHRQVTITGGQGSPVGRPWKLEQPEKDFRPGWFCRLGALSHLLAQPCRLLGMVAFSTPAETSWGLMSLSLPAP